MADLSPHPCNCLVLICRPRVLWGLRTQEDKHFEGRAADKDAKGADRPRRRRKSYSRGPTFITGLQVVLNRGAERLINPPLLSEDVSLQASQDGAYLRIHVNQKPFVTIP